MAFAVVGLLVALLAIVAIIAGLASSSSSSSDSAPAPAAAGSQNADTPSPSTPAPEVTAAADLVGTCWAASGVPAGVIEQVDCSAADVDFKVASVVAVGGGGGCPGEWRRWEGPGVLCMDTWPPITYQTCVKVPGDAKDCVTGLAWAYSYCWNVGRGAVLQQQIKGQWKTVKSSISKKDGCRKNYPWTVEFTRKAAGPGVKNYRIYFPPADEFTVTIEPITVTVREK